MEFIGDPYLKLYLPLYLKDAPVFPSEDLYGRLCTRTGAIWTPQGHKFDPTDDIITIPDHASLDLTEAVSILAWVNPTTVGVAREILSKGQGAATDSPYGLRIKNTNDLYFFVFNNVTYGDCDSVATLSAGFWYFVAGVYNKVNVKSYINGVEDGSDTYSNSLVSTTGTLRVGAAAAASNPFGGVIGEVWLYSRALPVLEIRQLYQLTRGRYGV